MNERNNHKKENERIQKEFSTLNSTNKLLHQQLENLVRDKNEMELIMVHKFKDILNAKKRKIRKLLKVKEVRPSETQSTGIEATKLVPPSRSNTSKPNLGRAISEKKNLVPIPRIDQGVSADNNIPNANKHHTPPNETHPSKHIPPSKEVCEVVSVEGDRENLTRRLHATHSYPSLPSNSKKVPRLERAQSDSSPIINLHTFLASKVQIQTSIQRLLNFDDSPTKEPVEEPLLHVVDVCKSTPEKKTPQSPELFRSYSDISPDLFPKRNPKRDLSTDTSPELFPKRSKPSKSPVTFRSFSHRVLRSP
ncbi:hypothetical protein K7432_009494 [Basidiobolus ranarum]